MTAVPLHIVVVGNNPSAWYTLLCLTQQLPTHTSKVTLVVPPTKPKGNSVLSEDAALDHQQTGLSSLELVAGNAADLSLSTKVCISDSNQYTATHWVAHGGYGFTHHHQPFFQWWQRSHRLGLNVSASDFSLACQMSHNRCYLPPDSNSADVFQTVQAGLQFCAQEYCDYLARVAHARKLNVVRDHVELVPQRNTELPLTLKLNGGGTLCPDLILDCDGGLMQQFTKLYPTTEQKRLFRPGLPTHQVISEGASQESDTNERSTTAQLTIGEKSWQWDVRGTHCKNVVQEAGQQQFRHAWVNNLLAIGPAWADVGFSLDPLAIAQFQLKQLLPLLALPDDWRPLRVQFDRESNLYRDEANNFQNLCSWLAGHTKTLERKNRHRLSLFRASGKSPQLDHEPVDEVLWLLLPTFAGFWPKPGSIAEPGSDTDYQNWVRSLAAHYQTATSKLPQYTDYLRILATQVGQGVTS
ncbi:tryptophan 7-halogenase [Microbulbifer agarilyticus]